MRTHTVNAGGDKCIYSELHEHKQYLHINTHKYTYVHIYLHTYTLLPYKRYTRNVYNLFYFLVLCAFNTTLCPKCNKNYNTMGSLLCYKYVFVSEISIKNTKINLNEKKKKKKRTRQST